MKQLCAHNQCSSLTASQSSVKGIERPFDSIPRIYGRITEQPGFQNTCQALTVAFENSSLTPQEQLIVLLTIYHETGCEHYISQTLIKSLRRRLPESITNAIIQNCPIQSEKLQALRQLTLDIIKNEGWITDEMIVAFITAGYNKQTAQEVLDALKLLFLKQHQIEKDNTIVNGMISYTPNLKIV